MMWIEAALWGLFGGFAVEGLDFYSSVRHCGCWPWRARGRQEVGAAGYCVGEFIRLVIGGGLAWAALVSGQITSPAGAMALGIAAPLIVERLTRLIPFTDVAQIADCDTNTSVNSVLTGPVDEQRGANNIEKVAFQGDQGRRLEE